MVVNVTSKCNLDCHFCLGSEYMEKRDTNVEGLLKSIAEGLKDNPELETVIWSGGEALLAPKKLWAAVEQVRETNPDCKQHLMTNGLSLRLEDLEALKQFDRVYVSIDGFENGERSIRKITAKRSYECFEVMAGIENLFLRTVLTRDQVANYRWHEDIIAMMEATYHLRPVYHGLSFDIKMEKELSPDHIINFLMGYEAIIEKRDELEVRHGFKCEVKMEKFYDSEHSNESCDCSQGWVVDPDGEGHGWEAIATKLDRGCNLLARAIGQDAYVFIRNYLEGKAARLAGRAPVNLPAPKATAQPKVETVAAETPLYKEVK